MQERASKKLQAARLRALHEYPYWSAILMNLIPIPVPESKDLTTMGVDRYWRLYYVEAWVESQPVERLAGGLIHECGHILRAHHERCEELGLEAERFNYAGDLEINDDIPPTSSLALPEGVLYPKTFSLPDGKIAEWYYEQLPPGVGSKPNQGAGQSQKGSGQQGQSGQGQSGQGQQGNGQQGKSQSGQNPGTTSSGSGSGTGSSSGSSSGPGCGHCGSCAHGKPQPYEAPAPGQPGAPRGVSPAEADGFRRKAADDIAEAASRNPGSVAGSLERAVNEIRQPQVPWRSELRSVIASAIVQVSGHQRHTFSRPNRRSSAFPGDFVLPARRDNLTNIAVVADTSASMSKDLIGAVIGEIDGILKAQDNKVTVRVLATDAAVQTTQSVMSARQVELFGGGGTDMGVGLEAAQALRPAPDLIVCITDGYTTWPATCPGRTPVTVVLLSMDGQGPDWARNIRVETIRLLMPG